MRPRDSEAALAHDVARVADDFSVFGREVGDFAPGLRGKEVVLVDSLLDNMDCGCVLCDREVESLLGRTRCRCREKRRRCGSFGRAAGSRQYGG